MPEATYEEVMKVRRDECAMRGHSWDAIQVFGREDPVAFVCGNCGRKVNVAPSPDEPPTIRRPDLLVDLENDHWRPERPDDDGGPNA